MNILIITAHPSSNGFTHKIAKKYKTSAESKGYNVEVLDLYKEEIPYLKFEDVRVDFPKTKVIEKHQELILWAEEFVFIFPMWNFTEPAILKNFYDITFTARFAFKYVGKLLPEPLLKGRTAKFFVTCDGPKWGYTLLGNPLKTIWNTGRLKLCGIKMTHFIYFDKMRLADDAKREKRLNLVEKLAKNS